MPRVKRRVCPDAPFGVGLRLSAEAARSLTAPEALAQFVGFLRAKDLYVFTINGFPYGPFHGKPVKEQVYLPDWRDEARLEYTNQLADLMAALLPSGGDESAASAPYPGAFKPNATTPEAVERIVDLLIRHVAPSGKDQTRHRPQHRARARARALLSARDDRRDRGVLRRPSLLETRGDEPCRACRTRR